MLNAADSVPCDDELTLTDLSPCPARRLTDWHRFWKPRNSWQPIWEHRRTKINGHLDSLCRFICFSWLAAPPDLITPVTGKISLIAPESDNIHANKIWANLIKRDSSVIYQIPHEVSPATHFLMTSASAFLHPAQLGEAHRILQCMLYMHLKHQHNHNLYSLHINLKAPFFKLGGQC